MADEQAGYALIGSAWRDAGRLPEECSAAGSPAGCPEALDGPEEIVDGEVPLARRGPAPKPRWAVLLAALACLSGAAALSWRHADERSRAIPPAGFVQRALDASPKAERALAVVSPGGQEQCEGTYILQEHVRANGKPTWKKDGAGVPRTIYFSNTGVWMIDNDDAMKAKWDCAIGYIHAPKDPTGSKMPWEFDGWERYDNDKAKWIVDADITVKAIASESGGESAEDKLAASKDDGHAVVSTTGPETKSTTKAESTTEAASTTTSEPATKVESTTRAKPKAQASSTSSEDGVDLDTKEDLEGHGPCNDPGEDCRKSKCCTDPGQACFEKNDFYATCRESCTVGMVEKHDEEEFRTPWSCYTWGRPLPTTQRPPEQPFEPPEPAPCKKASKTPVASLRKTTQCKRAKVGARHGEPKLLCFAVTRASGDELALVQSQIRECAGLFSCDHWLVYSNDEVCLNPGDTEEVSTLLLPEFEAKQGVAGALTATWVNTEAFMGAWSKVITDGSFKTHDWVIKIDPDAVFLPASLRQHLLDDSIKEAIGGNDKGVGVYLRNCLKGDRDLRLFGSIEVLSSSALSTYEGAKDRCKSEIDYSIMGEDMWLQKCLDLIGVQPVEDYESLLADGYCPGSATACTPDKVAFHPFKLPSMWLDCFGKATGSIPQP